MRVIDSIDDAAIRDLRQRQEFFWLDVSDPEAAQIEHLGELLGLHPLAVEDSVSFGQRPKLDTYDDVALLVMEAGVEAVPEDENLRPSEEVHCYISGEFVVTLHSGRYQGLEQLKRSIARGIGSRSEQYYVYRVVDVIVDSYFPMLVDIDDEINELEDAIISGAGKRELNEIFRFKRLLLHMRKAVVPMRDVFARDAETIADLAGLESDSHDYFRDVYDHLIRITDELDSYHEMISSCTDLYLSTIANRQGEVSKQLTVIASIFLPLSFLTGFFGMNFDWEVDHMLGGVWAFVLLGVGTMALSAAAMWWWFHHKGWTKPDD